MPGSRFVGAENRPHVTVSTGRYCAELQSVDVLSVLALLVVCIVHDANFPDGLVERAPARRVRNRDILLRDSRAVKRSAAPLSVLLWATARRILPEVVHSKLPHLFVSGECTSYRRVNEKIDETITNIKLKRIK